MPDCRNNKRPVFVALAVLIGATLACGGSTPEEPASEASLEPTPTRRSLGGATATSAASTLEPLTEEDAQTSEGIFVPTEPSGAITISLEFPVFDEGRTHIEQGVQADYAHFPPSSGLHLPVWVEEAGKYTDPIPPEAWVHNLEHGWVVMAFNCPDGCVDTEDQLLGLFDVAPDSQYGYPKLLIFPNDSLPTRIVALAWGWELDLGEFDLDALLDFYNRHVDDGPEDAP